MRCATTIVNVLNTSSPAITTPIAANPSKTVVRTSSRSRTVCPTLWAASDASSTVNVGPTASATRSRRTGGFTPGAPTTLMRSSCAGCPERVLRSLEIEGGVGEGAEVDGVTDSEQTDDLEILRRPREQDPHAITDREAVLPRGVDVHRHLARTSWRSTLGPDELERTVRTRLRPRETHGGPPRGANRLAVVPDELRVAEDHAVRVLDALDRLHLREQTIGEPLSRSGGALLAGDPHDDVDVGHRLGEEAVVAPVQRVGQHVRARDEGDPEHHRDQGQHEAHAVRGDALEGRLPHRVSAFSRPGGLRGARGNRP